MQAEGQAVGIEALDDFLARERRFAVAFSGGCDSACLLAAAHLAGCEVKAYLVKTAFQAAFELDDARAVIDRLGIPCLAVFAPKGEPITQAALDQVVRERL